MRWNGRSIALVLLLAAALGILVSTQLGGSSSRPPFLASDGGGNCEHSLRIAEDGVAGLQRRIVALETLAGSKGHIAARGAADPVANGQPPPAVVVCPRVDELRAQLGAKDSTIAELRVKLAANSGGGGGRVSEVVSKEDPALVGVDPMKGCDCNKPNAWADKGLPAELLPPSARRVQARLRATDVKRVGEELGACPRGSWEGNTWMSVPECEVNRSLVGQSCTSRRWVVIAGDSNTRKNFHVIAGKLGLTQGAHPKETAWTGAERWNPATGFRLSFRFVPYMEMRHDHYVQGTFLLDLPWNAYLYEGTEPFVYDLPASVPQYPQDTPDVLLWNTGSWELTESHKHWEDFWQLLFIKRFQDVLAKFEREKSAKKFVWMTTPQLQPNKDDLMVAWSYEHVEWLNNMEMRLAKEAGHEICDIYAFTAGMKHHFNDHVHYGGVLRDFATDYLAAKYMCTAG